MSPKLQAVKAALERIDDPQVWGRSREVVVKELQSACTAAGFSMSRAIEDWARYQVAVGESTEQLVEVVEPEPEQEGLFG